MSKEIHIGKREAIVGGVGLVGIGAAAAVWFLKSEKAGPYRRALAQFFADEIRSSGKVIPQNITEPVAEKIESTIYRAVPLLLNDNPDLEVYKEGLMNFLDKLNPYHQIVEDSIEIWPDGKVLPVKGGAVLARPLVDPDRPNRGMDLVHGATAKEGEYVLKGKLQVSVKSLKATNGRYTLDFGIVTLNDQTIGKKGINFESTRWTPDEVQAVKGKTAFVRLK